MPASFPVPLPPDLLPTIARGPGLLLCFDYDGTLAEITADPARAEPFDGVERNLRRLALSGARLAVAIVTGRRLDELKRLLDIDSGILLSGIHGLELEEPGKARQFVPEALSYAPELEAVRGWLARNVPPNRGFWVEDKQVTVGLHYRLASPGEAAALYDRFAQFVAHETPHLKLVPLKMLAEAMPCVASKARAIAVLKERVPKPYVAAYLGDDTTDEDAFAVLDQTDVGVLVGAERETFARFRVDGPADVARHLCLLSRAISP
jgi:trehalose-phosphatase